MFKNKPKNEKLLFLRNFLAMVILTTLFLSLLAYTEVKNEIRTTKLREFDSVLLRVKSIENNLNPVITDITLLVSSQILQEFLEDNSDTNRKKLQIEFLSDSKVRSYYDQIRFINTEGMEVVRVNHNNGGPVIVPENQLQNKKNRYYFKKTIALKQGELYASPFDLNVEEGSIEYPIKPMIRIGMPVFDKEGNKKGIVIINYRGELMLREFAESLMLDNTVILSEGFFWLINSEGYWLKGPDPKKEWAFMYDSKKDISFTNEYSKEWETIFSSGHGQIHGEKGLFTYSTVFPFSRGKDISADKNIDFTVINKYRWKVVSFIPKAILHTNILKLIWKYIFIFIFINLLSLIGSFLLARASSRSIKSEEELKFHLKRRSTLQSLLLKMYQSEFKDLTSGLKEIVDAAYNFLEVDYVSVWRMNKENTIITCMDIHADSTIYLSTNLTITVNKFPEYFEAVMDGDQIVADDAFEHNATKGFKDSYLIPNNIRSMLDSPIWNHGKIMGILGLAYRTEKKKWTIEEQNFAMQLASAIAAMIETNERIAAEQKMKEAVREAEKANRTKSEFLANMSHEIRTPMNAILGFSELLLNKTQEEEDREYLHAINSSGKTLLYLINDILDLSKIEADKMDIINKPIKMKLLIDDMQRLFSQKTKEKKLAFIVELSPRLPDVVIIDEVRLRQILLNVIGNAVKFTDTGFIKLTADCKFPPDSTEFISLILNIEDTGIGIPKESRKLIFNPFEQTGKGSLAKYGGTGLGLAITKRLIMLMNGLIDIIDKEEPGTIFRITFPKVKAQ